MKKVQKIRAVVQFGLEAYGLLDAEVAATVAERYTAMLMDGREGDAIAFLADFVSDAHYQDIIVSDARSAHKRTVAEIREMVEGLPAMMAASRAHAESAVAAPAVEEPAAVEVVPVQAAPVAGIDAVVAAAEAEEMKKVQKSALTQAQLELMADSFEENFTDKPSPAAVKRTKRAPKRPHGSWWDDPQASKELVLSKAQPICDDILSRNAEQNTITITTKSGTKEFRWNSGPAWGLPCLMHAVIFSYLVSEDLDEWHDRTEVGVMRRSDIQTWVNEAIKDALARKGRLDACNPGRLPARANADAIAAE